MWNRGKSPAFASNIPKPSVTNVNASTKSSASKARMGPLPHSSKKRTSIASAHPSIASGSRIPVPAKNQRTASSDSTTLARANSIQRPPIRRKPRISRSKVISRLAFQRAADGNGNSGAKFGPRASNYTRGRTRSSVGAKVSRASHGGGTKSRASGEKRILLSAKKKVRQSECTRRKSKVFITPFVMDGRYPVPSRSSMMNVDG